MQYQSDFNALGKDAALKHKRSTMNVFFSIIQSNGKYYPTPA